MKQTMRQQPSSHAFAVEEIDPKQSARLMELLVSEYARKKGVNMAQSTQGKEQKTELMVKFWRETLSTVPILSKLKHKESTERKSLSDKEQLLKNFLNGTS